MARTKRAGRRSGNPDTRAEILAAARRLFADEGYESVSMRRIAAEAGVDPSLIHHYFGSKDDLFMAAIELPLDPAPEVAAVLKDGDIEGAGGRLMHAFVKIWDGPHHEKLLAVVRTSLSKPAMSFVLKQLFEHRIVKTVQEHLGDQVDHVPVRASFIASQVFGLVVARYILKLEPLASLNEAELAESIGPTIDRYLTMPVEHLIDGD
ncbi:TetR family transcriptional regulator [Glycomyces harbinensis]|uniref:Transcriptional regulator, TetR family n=1 Tax=Glycomyces harbinensis TaxID=58114 RepID=A0A1G7A0K0_9ACTN|nr:TetR family transcriptional regulator [Glycomyces harbinensis]SDE08261.1 transcriptional regulator, TetR family [Glycomyces harbinensis]